MAADPQSPPGADDARVAMSARPELRPLTSIRGIAAWWVVLYHIRLSLAWAPASVIAVFAKGYLAVDFFFLLSGFVIWLTYGERLRAGGLGAVPSFLKRRIARIWPLHLFMLGCAVLLALFLAATGRHDATYFPFTELPLQIFLVQNWGFTHELSWNDPAWSISAEFGAYLLFPFLVMAIDWRRVPTPAILAGVAALFVLLYTVMTAGGALTLGTGITRYGLLRCVVEFSAGTAICALWLRWRARPVLPTAISALVAVGALRAWDAAALPETLAIPLAFAAILLALALTSEAARNPLNAPALHYLGEISYATYLGHFMLFVLFKLALIDDPRAIPPVLIVLYLTMVLTSSVALYHLVERPTQKAINGWRWRRRGAASATR